MVLSAALQQKTKRYRRTEGRTDLQNYYLKRAVITFIQTMTWWKLLDVSDVRGDGQDVQLVVQEDGVLVRCQGQDESNNENLFRNSWIFN